MLMLSPFVIAVEISFVISFSGDGIISFLVVPRASILQFVVDLFLGALSDDCSKNERNFMKSELKMHC